MKTLVTLVIILPLMVTATQAQIQRTKASTTKEVQQVVIDPAPATTTTVKTRPRVIYAPMLPVEPVKTVNIGNGKSITVTLKKNVNTGSEPAFNKINNASLPDENSAGSTCTVNKVVFTAESTTFMNGNNSNQIKLYPGAIYTFDDFVGGGYNEIITGRNPIRIYTDQPVNAGGTSGVTVNSPSGYTINDAGTGIPLIRNSINQGSGGADLKYRSFSSNSEAELTLKITAGGSYSGFSASANYSLNQVNNRYYLTIDVIKPMFTIKAERPANGFFIDPAAATTSSLMYVKEITYGTRILANIELKLEKREDILNFNAAYGVKGGVNFNLGTNFINKTTTDSKTVNAYVIGAPVTVTTFTLDKLEEEIRALVATCSFQHARPVSYTMGDMDGSTVATHSATDEYTERTCTPNNLVYRLTAATLSISTGADNKEFPSQVAMELYNSQTSGILLHQPFEVNKIEFKSNQEASFGLVTHPHTNAQDLTLESISQSGMALRLYYKPNLGIDAWKIEGVSIVLEFKDQNGAPHPTLGRKMITLNNATGFLNGWDHVLTCFMDNSLRATTSSISQQ
jgi:hypothetical protein